MKLEEAIPYLLDAGLLSPRELVRGDVRAEDSSRRNHNIRVVSSRGPSFFLKQAELSDPSLRESVRHEAALYAHFQTLTSERFTRLLPRFYLYDRSRELLVLELVPSAQPMSQYFDSRWQRTETSAAVEVGRILGACQTGDVVPPPLPEGESLAHAPWALRFAFPGPELLRTVSKGQIELIHLVQRDTEAWSTLEALGRCYTGRCLVHGDLRWDNVLVETHGGRLQCPRLIDWELSGAGDAAWDAGSALAAFLVQCLRCMEPLGVHPGALRTAFAARLPSAQTEIRAFWSSFVGEVGLAREASERLLSMAVRYCGARLLQYAYEWSGESVSPIAACFLQLGLNILKRPDDAYRTICAAP